MQREILPCINTAALAAAVCLWLCTHASAQTGAKPPPAEGQAKNTGKSQDRIAPAAPLPKVLYGDKALPDPVRKLRRDILDAARTGDINALTAILKRNKVMPSFSFGDDKDAIAFWKQSSLDGTGRDILSEMVRIFSSGYVRLDAGTPDELYVWPYHFALPLDKLTPRQQVELYLLITPDERKAMIDAGGYIGFRGGIAPNGAWQFFIAGD